MYQQVVNPNKPRLNLLILGHVDHGKTTLTAAITKVLALRGWANFQPVNQIAGGVTTVPYETETRQYAHTDCPTHADYVKQMLTSTIWSPSATLPGRSDGAILVVSALDSVMPETKEQVILARQVGVPSLVVFLNKCDTQDEEQIDLVELEVRELLTRQGFPGESVPVIHGNALPVLESSSTNPNATEYACIGSLLRAVDQAIPTPVRDSDKPFLMALEDIFSIKGRGTVATGQIERGMIKLMDEVEIIGLKATRKTVVTGIEMFRKMINQGAPGDPVGCILSGIDKDEIERGQVLAKPGSILPHTKITATIYVLTKEEGGRHTPFFTNYRPQAVIRTATLTCRVDLPEGVKMIMPGTWSPMVLELIAPVAMSIGDRITLREDSRLVATGIITTILS